jgi:predicted metal-dependent hydrolase
MLYKMDYTVQFSSRKTYSIIITDDLRILVKAPFGATKHEIEQLLSKHVKWIEKNLEKKKNALSKKDRSHGAYKGTREESAGVSTRKNPSTAS